MISCWTRTSYFFLVILLRSCIVISFSSESYSKVEFNFFYEPLTSPNRFLTALRSSSNFLTLPFNILCCYFISVFFFDASSTYF